MRIFEGKITEVQSLAGEMVFWLEAAPAIALAPGQYLLAHALSQEPAPLAVALFAAGFDDEAERHGFRLLSPVLLNWQPGQSLSVRGPFGHGFRLPSGAQRVALVSFAEGFGRLLPLVSRALRQMAAVTLFGDCSLPPLPSSIEAYPLDALPEALEWADFLAVDLPLQGLPDLRKHLGRSAYAALPCPAQVLLISPMPCGGMAECGACAVPARQGWKLACKDGPVFNLNEVDW